MKYFRVLRINNDGSYSYLQDVSVARGSFKIVDNVKDATPHVLLFSHREGYSTLSNFMRDNGFNFEWITKDVYNSYFDEVDRL